MTRCMLLGMFVAGSLTAATQVQTTLYVDQDSPIDGTGRDWAHAFHHLQDALSAAAAGDSIRIAGGLHRPDQSSVDPDGTGRSIASAAARWIEAPLRRDRSRA